MDKRGTAYFIKGKRFSLLYGVQTHHGQNLDCHLIFTFGSFSGVKAARV
jgi:hypothetical protein